METFVAYFWSNLCKLSKHSHLQLILLRFHELDQKRDTETSKFLTTN